MRWARCPSCGGTLVEEARACAGCGADLTGELLPLEDRPGAGPPPADLLRPRPAPGPPRRVGVTLGALAAALFVAGALAGPGGEERRARPGEAAVLGQVEERGQREWPASRPDNVDPTRPPNVDPTRPPNVDPTRPPNVDPTRPPDAIPPGWTWRPVGPLPARHGHVAIWTGAEVVLWGGERPGRIPEGAAYDPKTDDWRRISRSPLENRSGAAAGWTGQEVLVWGGVNGGGPLADGAAYDPVADRWRLLDPAPLTGRVPLASAWTGGELVVVGSRGYGRHEGIDEAAAYDPRTDRWRPLRPMPVRINEGTGVWTGRELVVYGAFLDRGRRPLTPDDRAVGAALDPFAGRWRALPLAPLSGQAIALAWDGQRVVAWDYDLASAAYDPTADRWSELPPVPLERRDCLPAGVGAGRIVFAQHCGQAAVFEPERQAWAEVPSPMSATGPPVFTGESLVVWLGPSGRPHDGTWIRQLG